MNHKPRLTVVCVFTFPRRLLAIFTRNTTTSLLCPQDTGTAFGFPLLDNTVSAVMSGPEDAECAGARKMDRKALGFGGSASGPGPAAHGVLQTTVGRVHRLPTVPTAPAFTVKGRWPDDADAVTDSPGPVYHLTGLTKRGRAAGPTYTMGAKLPVYGDPKPSDGPGPAAYPPPTAARSRAGIKILLPFKERNAVTSSTAATLT